MKAMLDPKKTEDFIKTAEQLTNFFFEVITENGKLLYHRMISRFVAQPITENRYKDLTEDQKKKKSLSVMTAYQIWACGAYIQKQKVFARSDRDNFLRKIWDYAYAMFDSEDLNLYFETVKFYENDKFRQAAKVIELVLEIYDIVSYKLYLDDKVALIQEMIPLAESFLGCILAIIEKHFRPEMMSIKTRDFYQYLGLLDQNFKIDKAKLKQLAGI